MDVIQERETIYKKVQELERNLDECKKQFWNLPTEDNFFHSKSWGGNTYGVVCSGGEWLTIKDLTNDTGLSIPVDDLDKLVELLSKYIF